MKVLLIVMAVVAVLLGAAYLSGWLPPSTSPAAPPTAPPSPTPTVPLPSPTPATPGTVTFGFAITDISGSGLSRTITAQITNTGTEDAHNVWAEVTVSSGGSRVKVNGQDYLRVDIGTLAAGQTVTREVTLSFSISDGLRIAQNGATFKLTIHSDEYTESFLYDYKP